MASKRGVSEDLDKRTKQSIVEQHVYKGKQPFNLFSVTFYYNNKRCLLTTKHQSSTVLAR